MPHLLLFPRTGIVGIGAMIVLAGIYLGIRKEKGSKLLSYATLGSWLGAMFGMVGVGYIIELNEVYIIIEESYRIESE